MGLSFLQSLPPVTSVALERQVVLGLAYWLASQNFKQPDVPRWARGAGRGGWRSRRGGGRRLGVGGRPYILAVKRRAVSCQLGGLGR